MLNALLLTQSLTELTQLWHLMTLCLLSLHLLDIGRYFHVTEDGEHEMKKRAYLNPGILQAVHLWIYCLGVFLSQPYLVGQFSGRLHEQLAA